MVEAAKGKQKINQVCKEMLDMDAACARVLACAFPSDLHSRVDKWRRKKTNTPTPLLACSSSLHSTTSFPDHPVVLVSLGERWKAVCPRMTSQYVTEPPTSGLVTLITSKGAITIELFPREAPLACRNFLTLALEGFYDNLIFHRLVPGFIIQSGDPSGTGSGGESIYGEPFAIEPHSRLKFNRRGLLAMAAEDKQNESQFFLTLDATPELQGKHTLFGKVTGNSIYTLLELAEGVELIDGGDRPRYPPKLIEVKVEENPFGDLQPRMTKEERRENEKKEREERRKRKEGEHKRNKGKGKKNTALLSFAAEEEGEAGKLEGPKSSHDLLTDTRLAKESIEVRRGKENKGKAVDGPWTQHGLEPSATTAAPQDFTANGKSSKYEAEPSNRGASKHDSHKGLEPSRAASSTLPLSSSSSSATAGREYLALQRSKYLSSTTSSSSATAKADSYSALLDFQSRLRSSHPSSHRNSSHPSPLDAEDGGDGEEAREYGASDDDDDWRAHRLDAGGKPLSGETADRLEDYEVLDPRASKSKSHSKGETEKREGKRGRDWVEDERRYQPRFHRGRERRDSDHTHDRRPHPEAYSPRHDRERNRYDRHSSSKHHEPINPSHDHKRRA